CRARPYKGPGGIVMTRRTALLLAFLPALALLALAGAADAPGPFTLEQLMSAPFPNDLVAAPAGAKFAWIQNARGVRNIWVAEPAAPSGQANATGGYAARQLTAFTADDGIDIGELRWTPDAQTLFYTRGADLETNGTDPNPGSNPAGPEHAIWLVAATGGEPRKLAEGTAT